MEITVSRQELVKELTATQSVVERKTTIPILSNFLIEAEGDRLNITATDLDQAIRTSAAVKVKKPGSCTIPARKLYDYIKLLPDGDISIKLLENHWVQIRSGRSNTKMVGMARARPDQVRKVLDTVAQQGAMATYKKVMNKLDSYTPLGYSLCGVVTEVGKGAEEFKVGQLVACAGNEQALHAEYNWVPVNLCAAVPDGVLPEHAAFATVAAIAMQGVRRHSPSASAALHLRMLPQCCGAPGRKRWWCAPPIRCMPRR